MKDQITLERIKLIHPKLVDELGEIYTEICNKLTSDAFCRFTHTFRSFAQQNELYAKGRNKPGRKVTNAKAGQSFHNYGLAVDFTLIKNGQAVWDRGSDFDGDKIPDWMEVVKIFEAHGWEWGGRWKSFPDYPHFQKTFGKATSKLQFASKIPGTTYPIL